MKSGKYNAKRTVAKWHGEEVSFPSKLEARWAQDLQLLEKSGAIRKLERQIRYYLVPKLWYIADFRYEESVGKDQWAEVTADAKGKKTAVFIIKEKLMKHFYGIEVRILK